MKATHLRETLIGILTLAGLYAYAVLAGGLLPIVFFVGLLVAGAGLVALVAWLLWRELFGGRRQ